MCFALHTAKQNKLAMVSRKNLYEVGAFLYNSSIGNSKKEGWEKIPQGKIRLLTLEAIVLTQIYLA